MTIAPWAKYRLNTEVSRVIERTFFCLASPVSKNYRWGFNLASLSWVLKPTKELTASFQNDKELYTASPNLVRFLEPIEELIPQYKHLFSHPILVLKPHFCWVRPIIIRGLTQQKWLALLQHPALVDPLAITITKHHLPFGHTPTYAHFD